MSKSAKTTIPFMKDNEFDYRVLTKYLGETVLNYWWIVFVLIVVFVITVSNGANLTDGVDGLTGTSAIIGGTLVIAYVSGKFGSRLFKYYVHPKCWRDCNFYVCI